MRKFLAIAASALLSTGSASSLSWTRQKRSPFSTVLEISVGVEHDASDLLELERIFWDVSNPASDNYAKHLSKEEVDKLMSPAPEKVEQVTNWLSPHCSTVVVYSPAKDMLHCSMTVGQAEALLPGVEYYSFTKNNNTIHRSTATFHRPAAVSFVAPTTHFPSPLRAKPRRSSSATGNRTASKLLGVDPMSIRSLYQIGDVKGKSADNRQMAAGFLNDAFQASDLPLFYSNYYPAGKGQKVGVKGPMPRSATIEGSLDVEYLTSIGSNIPTTYWYTAGDVPYPGGENEPFVTWLTNVNALTDSELPHVISVSYADEEFVVDPGFQGHCDVQFQKLGVRGVSLFFGSGDDGVTGDHGVCPNNQFVPWWPASSPYVTGVGATEEFEPQGASFSGGGFSNRYPAPAYQKNAIATFKSETGVKPAAYNATGAGFPDVSAVGMGFWSYVGGIPTEIGGTSASTPVVAGMFSLINDQRLQAGKKPLGNVNQLIYAHPEAFTDITDGTNTGGGGCGYGGFACVKGWDPVTGMGTPIFPALLKAAMALP